MRILWLCPLVNDVRPTMWRPKILQHIYATGEPIRAKWITTDAIRATKWAVGVAETTVLQQTLIDADTAIHMVDKTWWTRTFGELPGGMRTRIRNFLTNAGIALPPNSEVLLDLFMRVIASQDALATPTSLDGEVEREGAAI